MRIGVGRRSPRRVTHALGPPPVHELLERGHPRADLGPLDGSIISVRRASSGQCESRPKLESVPKIVDSSPVGVLPPLPAENVASLGNTIRLGELEVTPLDIVATPLDLVRSIEPADWRREESPALVLRLKLKNISADHAFAPLERRFCASRRAAVDRSSIVTSQGKSINLFPLAVDSEWSIVGQEFPSLEPGESVETFIASEPGAADRLTDDMTWRVRLRIGPYRTDVLGVRFNKSDVARS